MQPTRFANICSRRIVETLAYLWSIHQCVYVKSSAIVIFFITFTIVVSYHKRINISCSRSNEI